MQESRQSIDIMSEALNELSHTDHDNRLRSGTGKATVALGMAVRDLMFVSEKTNSALSKVSKLIEEYSASADKQMTTTAKLTRALVFFTAIQALGVIIQLITVFQN